MSDRYIDFANSSIGHRLVGALGLPSPVRLERWQAGRLRPVDGALLIGGGRVETLTTEAVALSSGGNRRLIGAYAMLQLLLPALAFATALLLPAVVWRNRRLMRGLA